MILDDPKGVERRLKAIALPYTQPNWVDQINKPTSIEDYERFAEVLDLFIDILEDAKIGLQRELIPADEVDNWKAPRRLGSPVNPDVYFEVFVDPEDGIKVMACIEDKTFIERGLGFEAAAMLIRSFCNLRMTNPK